MPTSSGSWPPPRSGTGTGSATIPGRILVVEGTDGRGKRYHSEVAIFRYDGQLKAINAVYWGRFEVFNRERNEQRLRDADERNKELQKKQGK